MEPDNGQNAKPIRIERLQQSIEELDAKINKLVVKRESLQHELETVQNNAILAIINEKYKTPREIAEFIKQAKNGGHVVTVLQPPPEENLNRTEEANVLLESGAGEE